MGALVISGGPETVARQARSLDIDGLAIRALVAEPDSVSSRLVCSLLWSDPGTSVDCVDPPQLIPSLERSVPDLLVTDIRVPLVARPESWSDLGLEPPPAIIASTFSSSAPASVHAAGIEVLQKPFDVDRLREALARSRIRIVRAREEQMLVARSPEAARTFPYLTRIAVEVNESILLVRVEDVEWFEAAGNHVRVHSRGFTHLIRQTMKSLLDRLDPKRFLRVHRNAIVNLDHVREFQLPTQGNMFVVLNDGFRLPVRRHNRAHLRRLLKQICF